MCTRAWCTHWSRFTPQPKHIRLPKIISNNSYAHSKHRVNPGQVRGFNGVLYKLWPLPMPWLAASRCQPRWCESRSKQMWLSHLARHWRNVSQVARHWRTAGQGWHWISASLGLAMSRGGVLRNTWQAAHANCSLLHPTQHAHTPHTPTNSPPLPVLAHWTDINVSVLGWNPARKERTNERTNKSQNYYCCYDHQIFTAIMVVGYHQTNTAIAVFYSDLGGLSVHRFLKTAPHSSAE